MYFLILSRNQFFAGIRTYDDYTFNEQDGTCRYNAATDPVYMNLKPALQSYGVASTNLQSYYKALLMYLLVNNGDFKVPIFLLCNLSARSPTDITV